MSERITATIYEDHRDRLDELADDHDLRSDAEAIRWCIENATADSESDATAEDVLHALETHDAETSERLGRIEARMATKDEIEPADEGGLLSSLTDRFT